jgi:hypothetical protein
MTDNPAEVIAELTRYQQASSIYDQIDKIQSTLLKANEMLLVATGGIWAASASTALALNPYMKAGLSLLLVVAASQVWVVLIGGLASVRARFEMVDRLGARAFPQILELGRSCFAPRWRWTSWGKNRWDGFWYTVPAVSLFGSAFLFCLSAHECLK